MADLQTGELDPEGTPPSDNLGEIDEGTPPSDLDVDDGSGTSPEEKGFKAALLAERKKRQEQEFELGRVKNELNEIRTRLDKPATADLDTQLRNMSVDDLQNLYDSSVDYENPNYEQLKPLRSNITKALRQKQTNETVESLTLNDLKRQANKRAIDAYPDIDKPESEIFRTTQQIMTDYGAELMRAGTNIDRVPRFMEICVNEAAKRLGIEAKTALKKGQSMEYDRQMAAGKAGFDGGKKKTTVKEPEISENLRKMSEEIGLDPKNVAVRKKRLLERGR